MPKVNKTPPPQQSDSEVSLSPKKEKSAKKEVSVMLLKQLRATAALVCLDHVFHQDSMKGKDQQVLAFNCFYGNKDLNMSSQIRQVFMVRAIMPICLSRRR